MRYLIAVAACLCAVGATTTAAAKPVSRGCQTHACAQRVCKTKCQQRRVAKRRAANPGRAAFASWYGPGLYGNKLGCGGYLSAGTVGVAHKTLPCGRRLTVCYRGRCSPATVVDRGPYVGGREFDLTSGLAQRIGFSGVGWVKVIGG